MMSRKYYWTREEEKKLVEMWKKGITNFEVLAKEFGRKPRAIQIKLNRLGVVVVKQKFPSTTTTTIAKKDLLTHEEALKILAGILRSLQNPGQDKLELQRLRILAHALQTYDSILEKFEKWVDIENRLLEVEKQIDELAKLKEVQS